MSLILNILNYFYKKVFLFLRLLKCVFARETLTNSDEISQIIPFRSSFSYECEFFQGWENIQPIKIFNLRTQLLKSRINYVCNLQRSNGNGKILSI